MKKLFPGQQGQRYTRLRAAFLAKLILGILVLVWIESFMFAPLTKLSNSLDDWLLKRHAAGLQPDPDILIIDIDDQSLSAMAEYVGKWPWPRSLHAELLEMIMANQPKAVIFDFFFVERDVFRPHDDAYFNEVLARHDNVYLPASNSSPPGQDNSGYKLSEYRKSLGLIATPQADPDARANLVLPVVIEPEHWHIGSITVNPDDADGVLRHYPLFHDLYGWKWPSMPARIAMDMGYTLPRGDNMRISWRSATSHETVSYAGLYQAMIRNDSARIPELKDRILLIGTSATGLSDVLKTPIYHLHPGIDILATAIGDLKNDWWLGTVGWPVQIMLLTGVVALQGVLFWRGVPWYIIAPLLLLISIALLTASRILLYAYWLLSVLRIIFWSWIYSICCVIASYLEERHARQRIEQAFKRAMDPHVVEQLLSQKATAQSLSGEVGTVTVLFADIRGFTSMSETMQPREIFDMLNQYFEAQTRIIFEHNGTIDKFIGDAIMAFWGAPIQQSESDQSRLALKSALQMLQKAENFSRKYPGFKIGIGLHTGEVIAGFIGSEQRQDYTVIGDTVNVASRIEGQTKKFGALLVSEQTRQACGENSEFQFIKVGEVSVKGRKRPVSLYQVIEDKINEALASPLENYGCSDRDPGDLVPMEP